MYHCPNCNSVMQTVTEGGLKIEHCSHCGGCFFDDQELYQTTPKVAQMLSDMQKAEVYEVSTKKCPKDDSLLQSIEVADSSKNIHALSCPSCSGIFSYARDVLTFTLLPANQKALPKKPQQIAKIASLYSLGAVMIMSLLFFNGQAKPTFTQAQDRHLQVIRDDESTTICTQSKEKVKSRLEIRDGDTDVNSIRDISLKPSRIHCITVDNSELNEKSVFNILLTSGSKTIKVGP